MKKSIWIGLVGAVVLMPSLNAAWLGGGNPIWIKKGKTVDIPFDRPPLGQPGDPVHAEWVNGSGNPTAFEDDSTSSDDLMGKGTPKQPPSTATVAVQNKGGRLSGPNGVIQNKGLEGPCIEVKMRFTYRYPVHKEVCINIGATSPIGISGGAKHCFIVEVWQEAHKWTAPKNVCPL